MDAFHGEGRSARPLRDGPVLCLYDGARRGITVEATEDFARYFAIGALRTVFVNHVEKRELNACCRLPCHFLLSCHCSTRDRPPSRAAAWGAQPCVRLQRCLGTSPIRGK